MNIHIIVEGDIGEKHIYEAWVPFVNPRLSYVSHISLTEKNNFSIVSGGGCPRYFDVIGPAIEDVNNYNNIDRLVIAVDSEELSYSEKLIQIKDRLARFSCKAEIKMIIQDFCIETWALGNRNIISTNSQSRELIQYKKFFNVRSEDPELLPPYEIKEWNRAQFAMHYLKKALNDKFKNLTYNKSNPKALLHEKYFNRVKARYEETNHIKSFNDFLRAFT